MVASTKWLIINIVKFVCPEFRIYFEAEYRSKEFAIQYFAIAKK